VLLYGLGPYSPTLNHCRRSRVQGGPQKGADCDQEAADAHQGEVQGDPARLAFCLLFEGWLTCRG
jgi:hypothetical protein